MPTLSSSSLHLYNVFEPGWTHFIVSIPAYPEGATTMSDRIVQAAIVLLGVPAVLVAYITATEWLVLRLPEKRRPQVRPWLWIGPAVLFLSLYLVYPSVNTIYLSLLSAKSDKFVGLSNYVYAFTNRDMLLAFRNNLLWLILF